MTPRAWKRLFMRSVLWAAMTVGLVVLFFLMRTTWQIYGKEREAAQEHANEAQALAELSARKAALSTEIDRLNSPQGIDAEIRERYPVAKTGEEVIVLTNNPNATSSAPAAAPSPWQRFVDWLSW